MKRELIIEGTKLILQGLEVDPNDHNFARTPERFAKVFEEVFSPKSTGWPVFEEDYTDMVILRGHTFWTFCPHHLLPVKIKASVAYIPDGKVIGASKLARIIHEVNVMPLTQEKITANVLDKLRELTSFTSKGEAVLMEGNHGCFAIRGVKSTASMITCKFNGVFNLDPRLQDRFLTLARLRDAD